MTEFYIRFVLSVDLSRALVKSKVRKMALAVRFNPVKVFHYAQCARSRLLINSTKERQKWPTFRHVGIMCQQRMYSEVKMPGDGATPNPKKKKTFIPRVTLLSETNEMSVVTLEMAQKMAERRNLKLVKIIDYDAKTERPTYRLMTSKQYIQEGLEVKKQKKQDSKTSLKAEKLLSISTKITDHDLLTKIKSISKLLMKKHEIRILISYDDNKEKAETMFTQIQTALRDMAPSVSKVSSGNNLKIYLRPQLQSNDLSDQEISAPVKKEKET